ncbi:serine hydrolase domain-containing protein [Paenibacillus dakarensis]|uniref:serine hydrolase domain-containing protein n=1 Tax=Paenibacillus dakarensis TaxID=1527293 RepID=UPI0006D5B2E9|nr:serine hydrolase [Paenibacillus dakarensis]
MAHLLEGFVKRITDKELQVFSARVRQNGEERDAWDLAKDQRRLQHSVSKSFTCMAVGLAIEEGKLSLDHQLGQFFPSEAPVQEDSPLHPGHITLYNLLRMSTGHDSPPLWAPERASLQEKDWAKYYMSLPLDRKPGETFTYSSGDTFMISALFQAVMGQTVKDYLTPRLFDPLEIRNVTWETSPLGITLGCAGLSISNEELSRFGQMLLKRGEWNGQQLVPAEWIDFVTHKHIDSKGSRDWEQGYGCQFWMCTHDAYRADGAQGQLCIILPKLDAVIAINSNEDRMQDIMDAVWSDIYPLL